MGPDLVSSQQYTVYITMVVVYTYIDYVIRGASLLFYHYLGSENVENVYWTNLRIATIFFISLYHYIRRVKLRGDYLDVCPVCLVYGPHTVQGDLSLPVQAVSHTRLVVIIRVHHHLLPTDVD